MKHIFVTLLILLSLNSNAQKWDISTLELPERGTIYLAPMSFLWLHDSKMDSRPMFDTEVANKFNFYGDLELSRNSFKLTIKRKSDNQLYNEINLWGLNYMKDLKNSNKSTTVYNFESSDKTIKSSVNISDMYLFYNIAFSYQIFTDGKEKETYMLTVKIRK